MKDGQGAFSLRCQVSSGAVSWRWGTLWEYKNPMWGGDGPTCFSDILALDTFKTSRWSYTIQIWICPSRIYRGGHTNTKVWD